MSEIHIRRATVADAPAYFRIMGEPGVYANLMRLPHPSEATLAAWLTDTLAPGKLDMLLVAELAGAAGREVVGTAGVHPVGPQLRRRHAMKLGISVHPSAQGRGVGSALMQALVDYADRWAQVLRLELDVFADNTRAIALYRKFGFVLEGTHRAFALRDGAYVDSLSMARLHPAPPRIHESHGAPAA